MNYTVKLNPTHSQWRPVAQYSVPVTEVTVTESSKPRVEPELMDLTEARAVLARIMSL